MKKRWKFDFLAPSKKCDISNDLENNFGCFVFNSRNWWLHLFGLIFRLFSSNRSLSKSHCFKPFFLSSLSLSLSFFKPFLTTFYILPTTYIEWRAAHQRKRFSCFCFKIVTVYISWIFDRMSFILPIKNISLRDERKSRNSYFKS